MSEPNTEWPLKAWVVSSEGFASEVLARSPRTEHPGCLIYQCPVSGLGSAPVKLDEEIFLDRVAAVGVAGYVREQMSGVLEELVLREFTVLMWLDVRQRTDVGRVQCSDPNESAGHRRER